MTRHRMRTIQRHFNNEAHLWDERAVKVVPGYKEMLSALVAVLPFEPKDRIVVADLGTGSGLVAGLIKLSFPKAKITCIDMAPAMLDIAKRKLSKYQDIKYELADLAEYTFKQKFDVIASSLALHHLEPNEKKVAFYKKARKALKPGGVLLNADIVLASDDKAQNVYLRKWEEFLLQSFSRQDVDGNYRRYKKEDRPNTLCGELDFLEKAGFRNVDVYWKYYNFAVYGGSR
jgi:tRNA (cmo5U34)-methyltransferase